LWLVWFVLVKIFMMVDMCIVMESL